MSTTRVRIDHQDLSTLPAGRFEPDRVDATTEAEIASQQQEDEEEARHAHGSPRQRLAPAAQAGRAA